MKTLVSFALTLVLITGIPACVGFGPNPCGNVDPFFKVTGVFKTDLIETAFFFRIVQPTESAVFTGHFFETDFSVNFYSYAQPRRENLFMNTAYATSCADPGNAGAKEGIDSVFIIANTDLDSIFRANDTLNSIVNFSADGATFLAQDDFIATSKTMKHPWFRWKLMQKPTNLSIVHTFKVVIKLTNGDTFINTTPPFFFQ